MKKFIISLLTLLYISTSTGATIHMHYCMGELAGWGLGHTESKTCSKCGMENAETKENGCCNDEHTFLKNNTDQKVTESTFREIQLVTTALPAFFIPILSFDYTRVTKTNPISHIPPLDHVVPIYIFDCIYRI